MRCGVCHTEFSVEPEDRLFYEAASPVFAGVTAPIPSPTICPDCRLRRRLAFRNERHLYRRKSSLSGTEMITIFSPASPYNVLTYDEWWGDKWDPLSYGREVDFERPFFEQFLELSREVPRCPLYIRNGENSEYTNYSLNVKDCYLMFGTTDCERCLYGKSAAQCVDIVDCLTLRKCELCYEGIASENCYNCRFFANCFSCADCFMVDSCEACSNCALCFGLYRKEYFILNEFVGKERFLKFKESLAPLNAAKIEGLRSQLENLARGLPHRASRIVQSEDCTGDNISESRNCKWCFDTAQSEDCKYLFWTPKGIRSYDSCFNSPDGVELCYEVCSTLGSRCMGTFMAWNNDSAFYCVESHYNRNIFGCVGLRHKQYCILNRQYSEAEYNRLVLRIVAKLSERGEWGEYFAPSLSPFGYNETIAQEYFPLSRADALELGFRWHDENAQEPSGEVCRKVPENINVTDDGILNQVLICEATKRRYKTTPAELKFYRRLDIPIPRYCPDERHRRRLSRRNPLTLWQRKCAASGEEIWTSYPPQDPTVVYSNEAYRLATISGPS